MERLQQRQRRRRGRPHRAALERPFHSAWAGAADGDVVLVEFFDYACAYCRASNPDVERLLREDPRLKVVWRELPVLGPGQRGGGACQPGRGAAGPLPPVPRPHVRARPADRGGGRRRRCRRPASPPPAPTDEGRAELARNIELARAVGASGTPTFVVGDRVLARRGRLRGAQDAIAAARAAPIVP